jgi:hypothetical protein
MANSSHNRAFQAYNSHNFKNNPTTTKTNPILTTKEPLVFGRIPYSSIKQPLVATPSIPSSPSPNSIVKPTPLVPKRRASISSMGHFLPRRKSLQITALASQRQSLWMNIAKNAQANNTQPTPTPTPFPLPQEPTNLLRKKLLRLLLVFSYLLSISLFGVALATFYGFFWSGYGRTGIAADIPNIFVPSNSSIIDMDFSLEDVS